MSLTMAVPQLDCPKVMLPTVSGLMQTLGSLGALPSELERIGRLTLDDTLEEAGKSIQETIDMIKMALGNFPMGHIEDATVKIKEWEMQDLAQAIHSEWKFIGQIKVAEIVTKVIPINLKIPTPLGFSIDVIELMSNPEYKAELIGMIKDKFAEFKKMLPPSIAAMWSEQGITHDEMGIRKMWEWVIQKISSGLTGLIHEALLAAVKLVEDLGLSILGLADMLTMDFDGMMDALVAQFKAQKDALAAMGKNWLEELEKTLLSFNVFGMTIMDIMGGAIEEKVQSTVRRIDRMMTNLRKFSIEWPWYNIEVWIEKVMSLLEKIGISLPFIPFTFCDALTLIGMPKSISLPSGIDKVATLTTSVSQSLNVSNPLQGLTESGEPA